MKRKPVQPPAAQLVLSPIPGPDGYPWPLDYGLLAEAAHIRSMVDRWCPPLAPEDLIPIVGIELSTRWLIPLLPFEQQLNSVESCIRDCAGTIIAAEAVPKLGRRYGYLPGLWVPRALSEQTLLAVARIPMQRWHEDVLGPAYEVPWKDLAHAPARIQILRRWREGLFRRWDPDYEEMGKTLKRAYENSYGTSLLDKNPPQLEDREGPLGVLRLIQGQVGKPSDESFVQIHSYDGHRLRLDQAACAEVLSRCLPPDRRAEIGSRPWTARGEDPDHPFDFGHDPVVPETDLHLRELRDLADLPLLDSFVVAVEALCRSDGRNGATALAFASNLVQLMVSQAAPARRAAIAYVVLKAAVTEAEVADAYDVTEGQVEWYAPWASAEIDKIRKSAA